MGKGLQLAAAMSDCGCIKPPSLASHDVGAISLSPRPVELGWQRLRSCGRAVVDVARIGVEGFETEPSQIARRMGGRRGQISRAGRREMQTKNVWDPSGSKVRVG